MTIKLVKNVILLAAESKFPPPIIPYVSWYVSKVHMNVKYDRW